MAARRVVRCVRRSPWRPQPKKQSYRNRPVSRLTHKARATRHLSTTTLTEASDDLLLELSMKHADKQPENHAELIAYLQNKGFLKTPRVVDAFRAVDRGLFARGEHVYRDGPVKIGCDATITSPQMHAVAVELLQGQLLKGKRALDLGAGSGFVAAVMGHLVHGENGVAVGVDMYPELVDKATKNVSSLHEINSSVQFLQGSLFHDRFLSQLRERWDGFHSVHVGTAISLRHAVSLTDLLTPNGLLVAPVFQSDSDGTEQRNLEQRLTLFQKGGAIEHVMPCVYSAAATERTVLAKLTASELKSKELQLETKAAAVQEWVQQFRNANNRRPSAEEIAACTAFKEWKELQKEIKTSMRQQ